MIKSTFIYTLNDPETLKIRYVGKSNYPLSRWREHIKESRYPKKHVSFWIRSIVNKGLKPVLEIIDVIPLSEWESIEREYIRVFRAIHIPLTNISDGGESPPSPLGRKLTQEHKNKLRVLNLGKRISQETKKKISIARLGNKNCCGRILSESTKEKIGNARRGKKHSLECRLKMSLDRRGINGSMFGRKGFLSPNFGKHHSEDTRHKISIANLGKQHSELSKLKNRLAHIGKRHTLESCERMRKSQLIRWAKIKAHNVCFLPTS